MKIIQAIKKAIYNATLVDLVAGSINPIRIPEPRIVHTIFMERGSMPEPRCEIGKHTRMNVPKTRSQLKPTPQCRSSKIYTMASF